jgi:hypothetical protein
MPFFGMIHGAGVMGLADGPTEVHKVTVARQVLRDYKAERRHLAHPVDPQEAGGGQGQVRRVPGAGGGEPVSADEEPRRRRSMSTKLTAWLDSQGLGVGAPLEHRYISGGSQNEIYELRRGDLHGAMRIPPTTRRPRRTTASCASGGSSRRSTAPTCRHRGDRRVHRPSVLGRTFYLMGFVDGWSPMSDAARVAGALRHRPRGADAAWPSSWSRASRCSRRSTGRPRA